MAILCVASFAPFAGASSSDKLSNDDKGIIKDAMRNLEAVAWESRLARTNTDNDKVQHYGESAVGGADKLIAQLHELGNKYDLSYDTDPTKADVNEKKDLQKEKGKKFDKEYIDNMVQQHEELLGIFKKGAKSDNADVRSWFDKKQDAIREHLDQAKKLQHEMKD
jgi:putative membrane protein